MILGLGRSSGENNDNPLLYPCLENPTDRRAWWAAVHGVAESGMTELLTLTHSLVICISSYSMLFKRLPIYILIYKNFYVFCLIYNANIFSKIGLFTRLKLWFFKCCCFLSSFWMYCFLLFCFRWPAPKIYLYIYIFYNFLNAEILQNYFFWKMIWATDVNFFTSEIQ